MVGLHAVLDSCGGVDLADFKLIEQFELLFTALRLQVKTDCFIGHLAIDSAATGQLQTALTTLNPQGLVQANAQAIIWLPVW